MANTFPLKNLNPSKDINNKKNEGGYMKAIEKMM
jgi:hypothetical protein